MYFVGTCKRALLADKDFERAKPEHQEDLRRIFAGLFEEQLGDDELPKHRSHPLELLLDLPIWRFVTTNYDGEIERAIGDRRCTSLTQEDENTKELTRFALADIPLRNRYAVFHCHGRFDRPGSIIAGEADYQKWYLGRREGQGSAFRQSIELLFESNPLLFVGYGLGDEDLLRPLRVLGAVDPQRKCSRPLFAVMPFKDEGDKYRLQQYYERYGLHVISYPEPEEKKDGRKRPAAHRGLLRRPRGDPDALGRVAGRVAREAAAPADRGHPGGGGGCGAHQLAGAGRGRGAAPEGPAKPRRAPGRAAAGGSRPRWWVSSDPRAAARPARSAACCTSSAASRTASRSRTATSTGTPTTSTRA